MPKFSKPKMAVIHPTPHMKNIKPSASNPDIDLQVRTMALKMRPISGKVIPDHLMGSAPSGKPSPKKKKVPGYMANVPKRPMSLKEKQRERDLKAQMEIEQ